MNEPVFPHATQHLIGGKWVDGADEKIVTIHDPATGRAVAEMHEASAAQVDAAVEAAAAAFVEWSALSMNRRAEMQLRLQQTVEGLSVAAISYYVVGLFGYLVKAFVHEGDAIEPSVLTGAFVPVAVLAVWYVVRRIRRKHDVHQA